MKRVVIRDNKVFFPYKHASGGVWIDFDNPHDRNPQKQTFTHRDDSGVVRSYFIPKLLEMIAAEPERFPVRAMAIDQRNVRHMVRFNGIERDYLRKMTRKRMEEPGIMLELPDNFHIVLDGNHRYVRRSMHKLAFMNFHICTEETAAPAQVETEGDPIRL